MTAHVKAGLAPPLEHDPTFGAFITSQIRTLPDWLQPGMQFRDITPLLQNPRTLRVLIDAFVYR